jgi:hypothetical protein
MGYVDDYCGGYENLAMHGYDMQAAYESQIPGNDEGFETQIFVISSYGAGGFGGSSFEASDSDNKSDTSAEQSLGPADTTSDETPRSVGDSNDVGLVVESSDGKTRGGEAEAEGESGGQSAEAVVDRGTRNDAAKDGPLTRWNCGKVGLACSLAVFLMEAHSFSFSYS